MEEIKNYPSEIVLKDTSKLTDEELIKTIFETENKELAKEILNIFDTKENIKPEDIKDLENIDLKKAETFLAINELYKRKTTKGIKIQFPADIHPLIRHIGTREQEHFLCISLNAANKVIKVRTVTIGLLNTCQVHPREVFSDVIKDRAASVIIAHNHPSGNLKPSPEDLKITERIQESGKILGIKVLDHVIFNYDNFHSMVENGEF